MKKRTTTKGNGDSKMTTTTKINETTTTGNDMKKKYEIYANGDYAETIEAETIWDAISHAEKQNLPEKYVPLHEYEIEEQANDGSRHELGVETVYVPADTDYPSEAEHFSISVFDV